MTQREALAAPFTNGEVLQFTKEWKDKSSGQTRSMTFDYIEDETVMDRLDDVLGVGAWSLTVEPISVADGIVKVRLEVLTESGGAAYEDFGYQTRDGGEALKEAVSDGIRRVGRMVGIGRYLYHKHQGTGRGAPPPVSRPAARSVTTVPDDDLDFSQLSPTPPGQTMTWPELADLATAKGLEKVAIYQAADRMFGKGTKVTALDGGARYSIAVELGLVAA